MAETDKTKEDPLLNKSQSNANNEYLEKMKKEHPERVFNDKCYETKEECDAAKKEEEERKAKLLEKAREDVKTRAAKAEKATSEINKALYGQGADVTTEQMRMTVGGIEMDAVIGNAELVKERQHLLDPENYEDDVKKPNPGKMPNNEDAYPVDLKIEELETHKPDCKIHQVTTHVNGEAAARAAMFVGDTAEKRLIHLENIMTTMMRYLFRLGARVQINCMYYGGQSPFEKYKCIRCMNDDRISDGQMVQIDQCLTCTRYEPVYGQVYEVMNDLGANVAAILDDNQMGYSSMEDYVDLARTERFVTAKEKGEFDLSQVLNRAADEQDFSAIWGDGLKMNWEPVPKEDQRCHINWRQSINDDGSALKRLASFPKDEDEAGAPVTQAGGTQGRMRKEYDAMQANNKKEIQPWIDKGKAFATAPDVAITDMKNGMIKQVRDAIGTQKIDSLAIACLHYVTNEDIAGLVKKYADIQGTLGCDSVSLIISAIACGINAVNGSKSDGIAPIEELGKKNLPDDKSKTENKDEKENTDHLDFPPLDPLKKADWLWVEFAQALAYNAKKNGKSEDDVAIFCKVAYLYIALAKYIKTSSYDTDEYSFPFTDEQCKTVNGIQYSGYFGEPREGHTHAGIDLAPGAGNTIEFHAIHAGTVTGAGGGWGSGCNAINVKHDNGTYARYLHCSAISVSVGQQVEKGQVLGNVGGYGSDGPNTYAIHLHLECGDGDSESSQSNLDPIKMFANVPQYKEMFTGN